MASKTSSQAPSRRATVELSDDDDDDEQGSNGGTLDKDGDVIMEPVLSSQDEDDEDDESELRMSMLLLVSFVADYFEGRLTKEWTAPIMLSSCPLRSLSTSKGAIATLFSVLLKAVSIEFGGSLIQEMRNRQVTCRSMQKMLVC